MKKILLINGHPDKESYNFALSDAYKRGAAKSGAELREIQIRELDFDPNLQYGYRKPIDLEPDLEKAQELILWADHLVWVYPIWWSTVPAIMKGFLDRVLLPGFAFKHREGSPWWDRYLNGKTARLICTMDQPPWYFWVRYGAPSHRAMKKLTLQFCGVNKVKITSIGPIRNSKPEFRKKWIDKIESIGERNR
ncbi:MAG: NAD(P)H-dependent oxidoreductase [Balneolaceae bacterium]